MNKTLSESENGPVDFAIITALRVERDAVLRHVEERVMIANPGDPRRYDMGKVSIPGSAAAYQVVVLCLHDAGNAVAASETAALLHRWRPKYALMVGIAGGFRQRGVKLGDVLVAQFVHYYEPAKMTPDSEQRRPQQYRTDGLLFRKAQDYEASDWKASIGSTRPDGAEGEQPLVHFGPLGCGEQVVADEARVQDLLRECPKMVGVAMEGAGVWHAVEGNVAITACRFLEIRGVSDLAGVDKSDDWHEYAANVAAAFAFGYLRSHPTYALAEESARDARNATQPRRVTLLRLQSLRVILPDEVLPALPEGLRPGERDNYSLDFTDLMSGADRDLVSPEKAVERMVTTGSPLLELLGRAAGSDLVVHGLVHIPLAVLAGHLVSDRLPTHLFDFHPSPGTGDWRWPEVDGGYPELDLTWKKRPRRMHGPDEVIMRVSVSYPTSESNAVRVVPRRGTRVALELPTPKRCVVRSEKQVRDYGKVFRTVLDRIASELPDCNRVHLFYAGPVALAFHLGQQVSENIHPPVVVWNFRLQAGGYNWGIDLARATRGEADAVIHPTPSDL